MEFFMRRSFFPALFDEDNLGADFPLLSGDFSSDSGLSVYENKKHVFVEASLPGLEKAEVDISIEKNILVIHGEKRTEEKDKEMTYHKKSHRSYSYRLAVPGKIDESKEPKATFSKGILKITFEKKAGKEDKKSKKIPISGE